jgi:hypothetical protein
MLVVAIMSLILLLFPTVKAAVSPLLFPLFRAEKSNQTNEMIDLRCFAGNLRQIRHTGCAARAARRTGASRQRWAAERK